jgi:hypothetical protein
MSRREDRKEGNQGRKSRKGIEEGRKKGEIETKSMVRMKERKEGRNKEITGTKEGKNDDTKE